MRLKKFSWLLVVPPLAYSAIGLAEEKGVAYGSDGSVWRNSYGECWTTPYRDKDTVKSGCFGAAAVVTEGDTDGDGVADSQDQCPGTPMGTPVDARGCALDSDGDGVADARDKCPGTPAGATVDDMGCESDSDRDGVADGRDQCPHTPEGATVDARGCALAIVLRKVHFQLNSGKLTGESRSILDQVAASIMARKDIKSIKVVGHTDSTGEAGYNQRLSEKRAKAVADYLVDQGVDGTTLSSVGMGESDPATDNDTAEGRAKNRRVELKLN